MAEKKKSNAVKTMVICLLVIAILAGIAWIAYPWAMFYFGKTDHFNAHIALTVNGTAYTPQASDISGGDMSSANNAQSYSNADAVVATVNDDGTIDVKMNAGLYGNRDVAIQLDGMDEPLILRVMIAGENDRAKLDIHADVDTEAKTAHVTGSMSTNDDPAFRGKIHSDTREIDKTIDMTADFESVETLANNV